MAIQQMFFAGGYGRQSTVITSSGTGNITAPIDARSVTVEALGGGGNGFGATANANKAGGGGGQGSKRISIKGGVFRKMVGGKEVGSIEDRHMNIIFVKMAHTPSRQFYEGTYEEGKVVSPACWSKSAKESLIASAA